MGSNRVVNPIDEINDLFSLKYIIGYRWESIDSFYCEANQIFIIARAIIVKEIVFDETTGRNS
ncbi:hypothetical protein EA58_14135 [Photobacterium galatheae]|uniref:Uncharacterized protein n=1 Tax=Photobacterium galatheae TaxID=1654360 RepID=A0A066RKC1_9GAMM|nr:hypothetical protein EA58_14135 [Photobacterium galatheae]